MSAQNLKQLKIKTAMLKRLRKQYQSYDTQTSKIQAKIKTLQDTLTTSHDQEGQAALKKNKQFLIESETVLSNVKQKFIQAFEGLAQFLVKVVLLRVKKEKLKEQIKHSRKTKLKTYCYRCRPSWRTQGDDVYDFQIENID